MVISKLVGGLGNQMFQYATGLAVAKNLQTNFLIDASEFNEHYKLHKYSLNHFTISARQVNWFDKTVNKIFGRVIIENDQKFDKSLFDKRGNLCLSGYWQSEKYFSNIRETIFKEFSLKNKPDTLNLSYANRISQCNSVSLHIRRADYVTNIKTLERHGVCDLNYYRQAIKKIASLVNEPVFYIFSDDKDWTRKNLKITYKTEFMIHNDVSKNYLDLWLMSQCKHNIIANSTFSWWGAWLNKNQKKIVIAPSNWYNDQTLNSSDLIPPDWIKI